MLGEIKTQRTSKELCYAPLSTDIPASACTPASTAPTPCTHTQKTDPYDAEQEKVAAREQHEEQSEDLSNASESSFAGSTSPAAHEVIANFMS